MNNIYVSFGIRLRSKAVLEEIGDRAGRILGCRFILLHDPNYPDEMIMQAEAFCLKLIISEKHFQGNSAVLYQLNGENIIKPRWDYSDELDLTPWILQEFRRHDSPDWYVPTIDELKKEAGID